MQRRDWLLFQDVFKEIISQYFYMPITQAAKEPNVGPAPLKKRCRKRLASG